MLLTIVLASVSTKIFGVSTQIGLTAASTVGAWCPRIASASWQVPSRQRNSGQARVQRLFVGLSMRRVLVQDGSRAQRSQGSNRCAQNVEMHGPKRMNRNIQGKEESVQGSLAHEVVYI